MNVYYTATCNMTRDGQPFDGGFSEGYETTLVVRTFNAPYPEADDPPTTVNLAYELFARTVGA